MWVNRDLSTHCPRHPFKAPTLLDPTYFFCRKHTHHRLL